MKCLFWFELNFFFFWDFKSGISGISINLCRELIAIVSVLGSYKSRFLYHESTLQLKGSLN